MVEEIRVIMFGKTGVGKSFLGNNILNKKAFQSESAAQSVTKEAKRGERMIDKHYKLVLVDTPGLFDTETKDIMETAKILTKTVRETKPGPHVFIFVLSITSRYTKEENAAIEFLKDLFGNSVTDYLIIVLTGKDNIDRENIDFETYVNKAQDDLKNLLSQCRGNIAINNWASQEEITQSINSLLQNIIDVYLQNEKKYYTDALLVEAEENFAEKLRLQEEEARRRERELEEEVKTVKEEAQERETKLQADKKKVEEEARERETKLEGEKKKVEEEAREREAKLEGEKKKVEEEAREREAKLEGERKKVEEEAREREAKLEGDKKKVEEEAREREANLEREKKKVEEDARETERELKMDKKKAEEEARERERELEADKKKLEQEQMAQQSKLEALQNDTKKTQMKYENEKKQTEQLRIRQQEAYSREQKAQEEKYNSLQKQFEASNQKFEAKIRDQDNQIERLRDNNSDLRAENARKEGLMGRYKSDLDDKELKFNSELKLQQKRMEKELENQESRLREAKEYFNKELSSNQQISALEQQRLQEEYDKKCSIQ